jgi:hypothetical protein
LVIGAGSFWMAHAFQNWKAVVYRKDGTLGA